MKTHIHQLDITNTLLDDAAIKTVLLLVVIVCFVVGTYACAMYNNDHWTAWQMWKCLLLCVGVILGCAGTTAWLEFQGGNQIVSDGFRRGFDVIFRNKK